MANIKSSAKRVLVSRVRAERNKADKSELKTTIKKFDAAATEGNKEKSAPQEQRSSQEVQHGFQDERAERIILKTGRCGRFLPHRFSVIFQRICK